jgi:hypothetical protein
MTGKNGGRNHESKWFALAILLVVPAVATPETKTASGDVRMLVHSVRVLDGVKIERDTVEFLIPCLDRPELTKLLGRILSGPEARD